MAICMIHLPESGGEEGNTLGRTPAQFLYALAGFDVDKADIEEATLLFTLGLFRPAIEFEDGSPRQIKSCFSWNGQCPVDHRFAVVLSDAGSENPSCSLKREVFDDLVSRIELVRDPMNVSVVAAG